MPPTPAPVRRPGALRSLALALALSGLALGASACDDGDDAAVARTTDRTATTETTEATDHAGHHPAGPGRYVALGDSYTAAPWTAPDAEGSVDGCDQSPVDYPHLVAEELAVADAVDASCTGATTDDLFAPQAFEEGPAAPAQLDAVTAGTTLVTVGIGGNDIGFADVIIGCLADAPDAEPCRTEIDHGPDGMDARIAATAPKVDRVLAEIAERSPHAEVYVVGYPTIFPAQGACFDVVPFTDADVTYLHGVEVELNAMLAERAEAAGATYVDTETTSADHHACAGPGTAWIEGLAPKADAMPFHPNALGATHSAVQVLAAIAAA